MTTGNPKYSRLKSEVNFSPTWKCGGRRFRTGILLQSFLEPGFPGGAVGKESAANAGDAGSIPGMGRYPRGRHENLPQYLCWKKSPWSEEPGGLQSMGSQRVRLDRSD